MEKERKEEEEKRRYEGRRMEEEEKGRGGIKDNPTAHQLKEVVLKTIGIT